ncbi:MAG: hypothetical protein JST39_15710 [Bacteroidetes bacterium]|nr:hypothetical protein [Bacteroidota bacterium]
MSAPLKNFLFSLTIVFPAIAGVVRYRSADRSYRPFFYYIFYSLFNELFVYFYIQPYTGKKGAIVNWEIFNLAECLLLLLQFYYWKRFQRYEKWFLVLMGMAVLCWALENFYLSNIYAFNPVFLIGYSFLLVLLSINTINHEVVHYSRSISRNPLFIICVGFVIFFIYTIVVFTILATNHHNSAFSSVFEIRVYINALTNILYAIGIFFVPRKSLQKDIFGSKENV